MKVLAVDSSSITASVAVLEEKKILAEFYINAGLTHSQTLAPMIDAVIKSLGLCLLDIDLFAVTQGPGSFTGLRIGMATIKGMAIGVGKKCVGVSSLPISPPEGDFVGTCSSGVSSGSCGAGVKRGCSLALLVCSGFAVGFGVDFPGALVAEGFFVPAAAALVEAGVVEAAAGCSLSDSLASWEYNISQSP